MKGPSLDAIRKLKEDLAKKKEEEKQQFNVTRLSTLEHRAVQGDKKAKRQLKIIESLAAQARIEQSKRDEAKMTQQSTRKPIEQRPTQPSPSSSKTPEAPAKTIKPLSFEELIEIAKRNTNSNIKEKPKEPAERRTDKVARLKQAERSTEAAKAVKPARLKQPMQQPVKVTKPKKPSHSDNNIQSTSKPTQQAIKSKHPIEPVGRDRPKETKRSDQLNKMDRLIRQPDMPRQLDRSRQPDRPTLPERMRPPDKTRFVERVRPPMRHRAPPRNPYEDDDDDDLDGFIVHSDEEDAQTELNETLRKVFGYDKRKYARREALLDDEYEREYRAIGKVSTFEDIEREEKRSAKLAAAEDKEAEQAEEERKARKKKMKSRTR